MSFDESIRENVFGESNFLVKIICNLNIFWFYLYRLEREAQLAKETAERFAAAAKKRRRASILNQKNRHKKKLA